MNLHPRLNSQGDIDTYPQAERTGPVKGVTLPDGGRRLFTAAKSFSAALAIFAVLTIGWPGDLLAQTVGQPATPVSAASAASSFNATLQPALEQVASALRQIQIDRWKLSRQWKAQFRNDAGSIQRDLSVQLPGLLQQSQSSTEVAPRFNVLRNIDALYDVLVRIATAANLSGGKTDAAALDSAVQNLESARKSAADGLLQSFAAQDQEVVQLRRNAQVARAQAAAEQHPKTIVVENGATHRRKRHRKVSHRKPASKASPKPNPATPNPPNPQK